MYELKIYKKDLKKKNNDLIIIRGYENNKTVYYISTKQAFDDYKKYYFFPYNKMCYNYALAKELLKSEIAKQKI